MLYKLHGVGHIPSQSALQTSGLSKTKESNVSIFVPITIIILPKISLEHLELLRPRGLQIQLPGGPRLT